jgi:hypothetical protein
VVGDQDDGGPARAVVGGHRPIAGQQRLRGARSGAVGRDPVQVDPATVLAGHEQVPVVPDRGAGAGERPPGAVDTGREDVLPPGRDVDHRRRRVRRGRQVVVGGQGGQPGAVRRPGRVRVMAAGAGEPPRPAPATRGVDQVDPRGLVQVPVRLAVRDDGQRPPVRRPGGRRVLVGPAGDGHRVATPGVDDEHRRRPVDDPALPVQPAEQPVDPARLAGPVVVAGGPAGRPLPGHERDPRAVRRPHRLGHRLRTLADHHRLARDADRQHPQLRAAVLPPGDDGQPRPVRRPGGGGVAVLGAGQPAWRAAPVGRGEPDRSAVPVGAEVDAADRDGDDRAVRGHRGGAEGDQSSDVRGLHGAEGRCRCRPGHPPFRTGNRPV